MPTKRGIYHSNVDNWDKAERSFTTALTLNKDLKNLYKLRGVARYFSANYLGAIDDFTKVLDIDSTDRYNENHIEPKAFYLKFKLLQDLNRWDSISNEIDVVLMKLNKGYYTYEFSYILYLKGLLLLKQNDVKNAEDYFTRAINIYNKNGKAFLERGRIYMNSGKLILAEKDLKQALNLGIKEASELLKIAAYN